MDTSLYRQWLVENDILDRSVKLFWDEFNENLSSQWAKVIGFTSPFQNEDISIDFHEASLKIEDISKIQRTVPSEFAEVRINVFFKAGYIGYFLIQFDFTGKWVSFESRCNVNKEPSLTMSDAQQTVLSFIQEHQLETSVETRMLDLVSEVGELSKELLKATDYGKKELWMGTKWEEEFGDVLFSLICIANSTGIDMKSSLHCVVDKYMLRFNTKGDIGSGR